MPGMEAGGTHIGPLERVRGRWVLGDATRPDAHWVEFHPEGLRQHEPDFDAWLIPWPRIMTGVWFTWGKHP